MAVLLDASALIALEGQDREALANLRLLNGRRISVRTSAVVLAQVWRGGRQANLAGPLEFVQVLDLDQAGARRVGELLGRARGNDVADAHLALLAEPHDVVLTSDAADFAHLLGIRGVQARVVSV